MSLSAAAREARRRFFADLEEQGFVPAASAGCYSGAVATAVGPKQVEVRVDAGFPYLKPTVRPLDPTIRGRSHQGTGERGLLCLWPDQGEGWEPGTTARTVIARVADWFEHDARGDWHQDDYAPDPDRLYVRGHALMVFGDDWPPTTGNTFGRFAVWAPKNDERAFLAGRPTLGESDPDWRPAQSLAELFLLGATDRHVGVWVRTTDVPAAKQDLGSLISSIDAVRTPGTPPLLELIARDRTKAPREVYLGVLYPDAGQKVAERSLFIHASLPARVNLTALDAIAVKAFEAAPADENSMRRRLPARAAGLRQKKVLMFGSGSLGSVMALCLAKSGVGELGLVDADRLRPGHVIRHAASTIMVGARKVDAVKQTTAYSVPSAVVNTMPSAHWDPQELRYLISAHDLVIDATATPAYSLLLGEVCREAGRPLLTTYTQRHAELGIVRLYRPLRDACPTCYEHGTWPGATAPAIPRDAADEYYETGCADPTTLAGAADIEATANAATRIAVRVLSDDWDDRNQALIVTRAIAGGEEPLGHEGLHYATNPPSPECAVCGVPS